MSFVVFAICTLICTMISVLDLTPDLWDQPQNFSKGHPMSLSQRDTDLIFRKRKIAGQNVLTSLERDARLLQGPDKGAKRQGVNFTAENANKGVARFKVESSTGLLRSGK